MSEAEIERKVSRLVGLGRRGRGLVVGVPQVEQALRSGRARLVLLATDGSFGQKKGVFGLSQKSGVPVIERFSGAQLAGWVGVERVTAVAVVDVNLARGLASALEAPPEPENAG